MIKHLLAIVYIQRQNLITFGPRFYLPKTVSASSIISARLSLANSSIESVSYALGRATITRPLTRTTSL